ncbi:MULTISPECIES: hypothetical protein [unclassified Lentimicrobium]|uniref:hypothetical protein n=1 Tax=unclassified Lentimicrobium TaxID=2677434 RepID=UPI00155219E9|nr:MULTISPECIES: hypothetical protein [unclassified Lentimicrobium]NPD45156.1 hypothetical protein [Lentimicrobium sp. S6]NPD84510.1 hypothetical protein [Lentimicrobium sp. L6]
MKNQFSFLNLPAITALEHAVHLLPGLDRVDLLWNDPRTAELTLLSVDKEDSSSIKNISLSSNSISKLNQFRYQKSSVAWYSQDELPFSENESELMEEDLFSEVLKSMLCLSFSSDIDAFSDVYIFYFRKDASEFGPIKSGNILNTQQKMIIGRLLFNSLKTILTQLNSNREAMMEYNKSISEMVQYQQQQLKIHKQESDDFKSQLDVILFKLVDSVKSPGDIIVLEDKAKELLRPFLYDYDKVKLALRKALVFVKTLQFGLNHNQIILSAVHFKEFEKIEEAAKDQIEQGKGSYVTHTKTYQFLEDLEFAAEQLTLKGVKLTSARVGQTLENSITAAAISDKIKNHRRKIIMLLEQYPEKWNLIRNRFRPIINIQERANESKVA